MDDPNVTYKSAFAELSEKLGRLPTANELLPLHEEYKKAFLSLPSELERADREYEGKVFGKVSAAGPGDMGFSREPAPQARSIDAREDDQATEEPLTNPRAGATREEGGSEPEAAVNKPGTGERRYTAGRGPGGGVMATCVACGREWERPVRAGRPASKCEECR